MSADARRTTGRGSFMKRLEALKDRAESGGDVAVQSLLEVFGRRRFRFVLLVFSLPPLIPIPGPFGFVFGAALALIGLQMIAGARRVWLPDVIGRRKLPAGLVAAMLDKAMSLFARLGHWLEPGRMRWLNSRLGQRLTGLPIVVLAIIIALPIPLGNLAPALALILLSLALIERDGWHRSQRS